MAPPVADAPTSPRHDPDVAIGETATHRSRMDRATGGTNPLQLPSAEVACLKAIPVFNTTPKLGGSRFGGDYQRQIIKIDPADDHRITQNERFMLPRVMPSEWCPPLRPFQFAAVIKPLHATSDIDKHNVPLICDWCCGCIVEKTGQIRLTNTGYRPSP